MFHLMDSGDTSVHILYEVKNGGSRLKIFSVFQMDSSPCIKPTIIFRAFPGGSEGKESACSAGDLGSTPESGRSPGEGNDYPLQYSCLENSTDR